MRTVRTSFRGTNKNVQNWRTGCVFGHVHKFWKGHDGKIKKKACKSAYLGSIFISRKYVLRCVLKVLYIQPEIQVAPWGSFLP